MPKVIFERVGLAPSIILGCTNIEFFSKGLRRGRHAYAQKFLEVAGASGRNSRGGCPIHEHQTYFLLFSLGFYVNPF